jgi:hypothetical protein
LGYLIMGKGTMLGVVAAALFVCGSAEAATRASCTKPRGYVVKTKTREAVIFTNRHGYKAYGCLYRQGDLVRLSGAVGQYRLAGRYAAYFLRYAEVGDITQYRVMVRDLRTGGFRHIEAAYSDLPEQRPDDGYTAARVTNLTLKRNGSVAWLSCFPWDADVSHHCRAPQPDLEWEAWRADTRGRKLLDASDEVRVRSLRRDRSTLTWRHGDETRTATLR